uniref:RICTOR_N domain-containing protein n=1 Tax=Macrostomum lignano TaxID=282301 RepID=A0A1I8F4J7_9PLAT
ARPLQPPSGGPSLSLAAVAMATRPILEQFLATGSSFFTYCLTELNRPGNTLAIRLSILDLLESFYNNSLIVYDLLSNALATVVERQASDAETLAYAWLLIERLSERCARAWMAGHVYLPLIACLSIRGIGCLDSDSERLSGQCQQLLSHIATRLLESRWASRTLLCQTPPPADDMPDLLISVLTNPDSFPTASQLSVVKLICGLAKLDNKSEAEFNRRCERVWLDAEVDLATSLQHRLTRLAPLASHYRLALSSMLTQLTRLSAGGSNNRLRRRLPLALLLHQMRWHRQPRLLAVALDCLAFFTPAVRLCVQFQRRRGSISQLNGLLSTGPEQPIPLIANALRTRSLAYRAVTIRLAERCASELGQTRSQ